LGARYPARDRFEVAASLLLFGVYEIGPQAVGAFTNRSRHCAAIAPDARQAGPISLAAGFEPSRHDDEDGDCGLRKRQARSSAITSRWLQTKSRGWGQSPLISVSQLFVTERGDPAQQGGGRL
jgi:hypothetical protein